MLFRSLKSLDPSFLQIENLGAGSNPNALPDFQMRGSSTVADVQGEYASSANQPLFILDGFESELTKIMDLDMNLVQSVTLLKDATAKAIYGAKAANGVIVIETRRPESGRIRDGSYFRCKNINLSYTFPKKLINRIRLKNLRVYVNVEDPFCFHHYPKGWDPEVNASATNYIATTYTFGVDLSF